MIQQVFIRRVVEYCILLGCTAVIIDKYIPHDGVKPGFDICSNIIFFLIGQSPVQGFLQKVLCGLMIPGQINGERLKVFGITQQHLVEFYGGHVIIV